MAATTATTVGTGAVEISPGIAYAVPGSSSVVVSNVGTVDMFIGGPAVTATGATIGVLVKAGTNLPLPALSGALYAISTSTGTTAVVGVF